MVDNSAYDDQHHHHCDRGVSAGGYGMSDRRHCYRHLRGITQSSAVIWLTFPGLLVGGAVRTSIGYNG